MFKKVTNLIISKQDVISIECFARKTIIHTFFGDVITADMVKVTVAELKIS